jgi:O-methyltransferase
MILRGLRRLAVSAAKPVVRPLTASFYSSRPLQSWPAIIGRIHEISVPRGVIPHATPLPIGTANINNLISLMESTREVPGDIAECGVFRGNSLVPMAIYAREKGIAKKLYGFDSFEGFAESVVEDLKLGGTNDEWKKPGGMSETSYGLVSGKIRTFGLQNIELVPGFFEVTFPKFTNHKFSFVHLDCDAYAAYRDCMIFFYPRLSPGGIVSFDEYNDPPWPGCNKAIDEFLADKPEKLQVIAKDNYEKYYIVKK